MVRIRPCQQGKDSDLVVRVCVELQELQGDGEIRMSCKGRSTRIFTGAKQKFALKKI